jgi:hypothetical protein
MGSRIFGGLVLHIANSFKLPTCTLTLEQRVLASECMSTQLVCSHGNQLHNSHNSHIKYIYQFQETKYKFNKMSLRSTNFKKTLQTRNNNYNNIVHMKNSHLSQWLNKFVCIYICYSKYTTNL